MQSKKELRTEESLAACRCAMGEWMSNCVLYKVSILINIITVPLWNMKFSMFQKRNR